MSNGDDAMTSAEFAKLMGAYPEPAGNPSPAYGGFMDNSAANFSWVQNNDYFGAEGVHHDGGRSDGGKFLSNCCDGDITTMDGKMWKCMKCNSPVEVDVDELDDWYYGNKEMTSFNAEDKSGYRAETWTEDNVCLKCNSPFDGCSCERCPQCDEFWNDGWLNCDECFSCDGCCRESCPRLWGAESFNADLFHRMSMDMPEEMWSRRHDQLKGERGNVHFDSGKIVRVDDEYYIVIKANQQMGIKNVYYRNRDFKLGPYPYTAKGWNNGYMKWKQVPQRGRDWATEVQEALGDFTDGYRPTSWNKGKGAESFNTENLSREGTYNIDIESYIDNEDELEERGYSQRDIEAMKQDVEEKYNDGDEIFEELRINELDIAIDGRLENDRDSVYLKYGDKMVGGVESGIDYVGDFGGFNDAETEYHGLSAEEYYAELNEFYADMEELTDGVSAIKNRFGDAVGMVQVDDEDLEDVSVEITDTDGGVVYEGILADDEVPDMEEEDYYLAEMKKPSLLALALGVGAVLLGGSLLKDKLVKNADNDIQEVLEDDPELIESPNMGDLSPADYEELVVESTGYAVDVIPMSLDGAFMGSRFAALPTERYVEYNDPGIGAHTDIALTRNENFLEPEMAMVQAAEGENVVKETQAPGQSPYLSMDGQEPKDFSYRVLKETHPVSLDPAVVPFIPQSMAGYTGNDNRPPSVYNKMFNLGVLGQTPLFVPGNNDDIGSSHTGSRRATPSKMGNIGGPLSDAVNASYTDGQTSKSLAQWSIENKVQQTSDTEAMVIDRSSGNTKRIRRV